METMRIFCLTCKEPILLTSSDFKVGGPYHGGMFKPMHNDRWGSTMLDCRPHTKGGDLHCPRCMGLFISPHGRLLTEHGVVYSGQVSIDTSFSIVHADGFAKGQLMHIQDSRLDPNDPQNEDWGESVSEGLEDVNTISKAVSDMVADNLKCSKCGRQYKAVRWRDKHQEKCKK